MAIPPSAMTPADIAATGYNPITQTSVNAAVTAGVAFKDEGARAGQQFAVVYDRFKRGAADARIRNPRNAGAMSTPPTVTVSTTAPTTSKLPFGTLTSVADFAPYMEIQGGWGILSGSNLLFKTMTRTVGAATGGSDADAWTGVIRLVFMTDDPSPTIGFSANTSSKVPFRILIDGQYTDVAGYTPAAVNTAYYYKVDTGAGRKTRRWEIEIQGGIEAAGGSKATQVFRGFYRTDMTYTVWAPSSRSLRAIQIGDSYTQGPLAGQVPVSMLGDGMGRIAGDLLGIGDWWQSGVGGTGYMWRGSLGLSNALDRLTDVTAWNPDMVVVQMGVNDLANDGAVVDGITISPATLQTRVQTYLAAIRTAKPALPICVTGPWRFTGTLPATVTAYENAIAAGVAALNDPLVAFAPTNANLAAWLTGTGTAGAPSANGNSDAYISATDAQHPNFAGYAYLGSRTAQAVEACMDTMAQRMGFPIK
jgi:lysophospholipase L1-like esterase